VITHSEYTQTDLSSFNTWPQPVKIFPYNGTQVDLISESPDDANTDPFGDSIHVKNENEKNQGEFTLALDQLIAFNLTKRNKNLKKTMTLKVNKRNVPCLNKSIHQMGSLQMIHHCLPWLRMTIMTVRNTSVKRLTQDSSSYDTL